MEEGVLLPPAVSEACGGRALLQSERVLADKRTARSGDLRGVDRASWSCLTLSTVVRVCIARDS